VTPTKELPVPADLDAFTAVDLRAQVLAGAVRLDWRDIEEADPAALRALFAGLDLDEHATALGLATMSESLARACEDALLTAPLAPRTLLAPPPPAELRDRLEAAVLRDILGPAGGEDEEIHERSVHDRYLVGMLAPRRLRVEPEQIDVLEVETGVSNDDGPGDPSAPPPMTMFPSSMGLSFCVTADAALEVDARWGRYTRQASALVSEESDTGELVWKRTPMGGTFRLTQLREGELPPRVVAPEQPEVTVRGSVRRIDPQTVLVSLFLVNGQTEPETLRDQAWIYQPELIVTAGGAPAFVCRAPLRDGREPDDRVMAMRYRDRCEFAVGHNAATHAELSATDPRRAVRVSTRVVPAYEVAQQSSPTVADDPRLADLCLDMRTLAETPRAALGARLRALPDAYARWIRGQRARLADPASRLGDHLADAERTLAACDVALGRIRDGLVLLAADEKAADAFRFANRAMWLQRIHTSLTEARRRGEDVTLESVDQPGNRQWRVFQLAFILLGLDSLTNLHHPHRSDPARAIADLLWFPTGGGKTEAYLGLAAYVMGLRRLQGTVAGRSGEHGVAVLMRYTLRLLTLQQFQRATALICACEAIRREDIAAGDPRWGHEPFRIGLWVGARSTPNRTEHAAEALKQVKVKYRRGSIAVGLGTPVQLAHCPWCATPIDPGKHIRVDPFRGGVGRTLVFCGDDRGTCLFSERRSPREGIPAIVVDEEVYRRLPTLIVSTVDKFAQMPWNSRIQTLFGQVDGHCQRHGFTAPELEDSDHPRRGTDPATRIQPRAPLRPPDLIIQDELHLISGPLGTLTGLYETAVDQLCSWDVDGTRVRPKVVASTATIRRAAQQIRALFAREVQVFPPHGIDAGDNFFARERPLDVIPGRRYLGVCAPGRRLKAVMIRVYVAQLAAAQQLYDLYGHHADAWMTLVGYFNSLRELAGMRRLVDDDVRNRLKKMNQRGLAARRGMTVQELTSRLGSTEIPELLDRLEIGFRPEEPDAPIAYHQRPIDVLLATNMLSVGVDVKRLGLMTVAGQPKTTAEYIQATSRVGRAHPGLVVTVYNWARPRDLSHYETFEHYHATYYKHVEALSLTPFAARALDRGLAALLVSLVRLPAGRFARNESAAAIDPDHPIVREALQTIIDRALRTGAEPAVAHEVEVELTRLLDDWQAQARPRAGGALLGYRTKRDGLTQGLLRPAGQGTWDNFTCLHSLRDVETTAPLVLIDGGLDEDPPHRSTGGAS
jgi:hypothetical protein